MTRRSLGNAAALLLCLLLCPAPAARAGETAWHGGLGALAGGKFLDSGGWGQTATQAEVGARIEVGRDGWPVALAADFLHAMARGSADVFLFGDLIRIRADVVASTTEADFGARKTWEAHPRLRPSLGGGVALVTARWRPRVAGFTFPREDSAQGFWLSAGLSWLVAENFTVGLEGRWSTASVNIGGSSVDAGGLHAGAVAGFRW